MPTNLMCTRINTMYYSGSPLEIYPKPISEILQIVYIFCGLRFGAMCIRIVELQTVTAFLDLMILCVVLSLVIVVIQRGWEQLVQWWTTFDVLGCIEIYVTGLGGLHCAGSAQSARSTGNAESTRSTGITRNTRSHMTDPHKCCEICMEAYGNLRRPAISGGCGHVYCIVCLSTCTSCPTCRVEFSLDKIILIYM